MKNNIISKCVSSLSTSPTLNIDEKIKSLSKSQKIYNFIYYKNRVNLYLFIVYLINIYLFIDEAGVKL